MSKGPQKFRQREVTRAIKAVSASGAIIDRVEISQDGIISVFPRQSLPVVPAVKAEDDA